MYRYPFRRGATIGRIDQGLDVGGSSPIGAIGRAEVTSVGAPTGWPGTGGLVYKLLEGPYAGRHVFVYEGVKPTVRQGQIVRAGQQVGTIIPGTSTGIEMGWSDANGVPVAHSEYTEGKETVAGKEFAALLSSLHGGPAVSPVVGARFNAGTTKSFSGIPGVQQAEEAAQAAKEAAESVSPEHLAGLAAEKAAPLALNVGLIGAAAALLLYGLYKVSGAGDRVDDVAAAAATAAKAVK